MKKHFVAFFVAVLLLASPAHASMVSTGGHASASYKGHKALLFTYGSSYHSRGVHYSSSYASHFNPAYILLSLASSGHHHQRFGQFIAWLAHHHHHHHNYCDHHCNPPSPVPLPAALPLFAAGLAGLALMRTRKKDVA